MKIEKLNKENIKEFIRDMKLDYTENLEQNINKIELYGVKKDNGFCLGFDTSTNVDTIAILHFNPKMSNEQFYECIEFLNKSLVVENYLIIDIFDDKHMKLLDQKYKCKEMNVILELTKDSSQHTIENTTTKEKFIDIEMDSIKYNYSKGNIYCNFIKQNIFDEKLIFDLHNYFTGLNVDYISYTIYEDSYEYLKSLNYKCINKSYIIKN